MKLISDCRISFFKVFIEILHIIQKEINYTVTSMLLGGTGQTMQSYIRLRFQFSCYH